MVTVRIDGGNNDEGFDVKPFYKDCGLLGMM